MSLEVLIIEDDPLVQAALKPHLAGHRCHWHASLPRFRDEEATVRSPDLILLDLRSPDDPDGTLSLEAIPWLRRRFPLAHLVVASGLADVDVMRACIQKGAQRFLFKEHLPRELPLWLAGFEELAEQRRQLEAQLVGASFPMQRLREEILALRPQAVDVLIEGETGSGKELCAQGLHLEGPFMAVNASAVPPELFESEFFGAEKGAYSGASQVRTGHFEAAGHGTLFLDEVQALSLPHQAKLLRVLETRSYQRVGSSNERPFRARLVCASNRPLRELVASGAFREDLYFRLAPISLRVPPLRQHAEDVAALAALFLVDAPGGTGKSFTSEALAFLSKHDWPGNVRQLRGLVRALALKSPIPLLDAPEIRTQLGEDEARSESLAIRAPEAGSGSFGDEGFALNWATGLDENVARLEKLMLSAALARGSTLEARERLGLKRSRFYEKLKQHGLMK
jgi:DNA-binding NtrC family response regulator